MAETDIIVQKTDEPGLWYWKFTINDETRADGYELSEKDARAKARQAREEWENRNRD